MYCQKCGKQIDEGSVFCQHCGAQIGNSVSDNFSNRNANLNFNVQHTERKTERIKSKEEFMDDYHAKHPERMVYVVLFIILEIAATIVFIMNVSSYIDHHRDENLTGMMIAAFLEIIAVIFACAIQKVNASANKAYDMYLNNINSRSNNIDNKECLFPSNQWECPKCGRSNADSVKYCLNCSSPKVITFTKPQTGEWQCPKCGKINQNYVGTCGCGEVKPK